MEELGRPKSKSPNLLLMGVLLKLGNFIKSSLWRRGFQNDEKIQQLANASDTSLVRTLHLLYCVLRRRVPRHGSKKVQTEVNRAATSDNIMEDSTADGCGGYATLRS